MSNKWIISFELTIVDRDAANPCSIIRFTNGGNFGVYGNRSPAIFLVSNAQIYCVNSVNGDASWSRKFAPPQNDEILNVELHQRYISNGNYRYFIKINGVEVSSVVNSDARQFYNVTCLLYTSPSPRDGLLSRMPSSA